MRRIALFITILLLMLTSTLAYAVDKPKYPVVPVVLKIKNAVVLESRVMTQENLKGTYAELNGFLYVRNTTDQPISIRDGEISIYQDDELIYKDNDYWLSLTPPVIPAGKSGMIYIREDIKTDHADNIQILLKMDFKVQEKAVYTYCGQKMLDIQKDIGGPWYCDIDTTEYKYDTNYEGIVVWARNNRIVWVTRTFFRPGDPENLREILWQNDREILTMLGLEPNQCALQVYRYDPEKAK